jgi:hypothetical protein
MDSVAGRAAALELADLVREHTDEIIERWARIVRDRLGLDVDKNPHLVDDLPNFLEQISEDLGSPGSSSASCRRIAASHGRHRVETALDIGAVVEELGIIIEAILEVARDREVPTKPADVSRMIRLIAEGTAESVRAYALLRDEQQAEENARYFSFVAHELRTPIQTARLSAHLLSEDRDSSEVVERLNRAVDQLADLIDNALTNIKIRNRASRTMAAQPAEVLLDEAMENARLLARRKNVELTRDSEDITVYSDRRVMVSALTNLVINAVKFTGPGGRVVLRASRAGERIRFEIEDQCGGISEEMAENLFKPFAQGGEDRTGFGLGLVIAQEAIAAHDGVIRVENRAPIGCRFVIEIPPGTDGAH